MRILFIQPYLDFSGLVSEMLPGQLKKRGYDVALLSSFGDKKQFIKLSKAETVQIYPIKAINLFIPYFARRFPYFLHLKEIIRNIKPEIIHINNLPFLTSFQAAKLARRLRIPVVVHVHGVKSRGSRLFNLAQSFFIYTFGRSIFRNSNRIICLTQSDAMKLQKYGCPWGKISLVPNGVDVKNFFPSGNEMDSLLWCGRFVEQKGLKYLIQAIRIASSENPQIKLVMTGDGPLFPAIVQLARNLGVEKNIVFRGRVARKEIPRLMNASSAYVLPSLNEGLPYVLLEAMACGKAVVGSDISGINDVIVNEQNGLLVPPANPKALANAILRVLMDGHFRQRIGQNARRLMVEKYSWDIIVEKTVKVYQEAIHELFRRQM